MDMDFGIFFFIAFIAIAISMLSRRQKANRRRASGSASSWSSASKAPRPLTVVGVEDQDSAINAVMAVTGASREDAVARLVSLPTTIWVPAPDVASALDIFAESGIAYATGSLGESIRPSLDAGTPAPPVEPSVPRLASLVDPSPRPVPTPLDPPSLPEPVPPIPVESPAAAAYAQRPTQASSSSEQPPLAQGPLPTPEPPNQPVNPTEPEPADPTWARVDPTSLKPETIAALAGADRTTIERNLRRLSMNGSTEADIVLGGKLVEWGRIGEAEGLFRSRAHDHPSAANNIGVIDEREGRHVAARRSYEQAAHLGSPEAGANLARLGYREDPER